MRMLFTLLSILLMAGCGGGVRVKSVMDQNAKNYPPNNDGNICLLAGTPPSDVKYEVLGRVVATKGGYGSTDELFPHMAYQARKMGADAVINLQSGQKFKGPLPWRVTSPSGDGTAIKLLPNSPTINCLQAVGKVY